MSDWISVSDKLPKTKRRWYLIAAKDGDGNKITTMAFLDVAGDDVLWLTHNDKDAAYDEWDNVTHWMPLPEPPKPLNNPLD